LQVITIWKENIELGIFSFAEILVFYFTCN